MAATSDADLPDNTGLLNPYRHTPQDAEVLGATLGRLGLAAGVIALAAASVDSAVAGAVPADTPVWLGTGLSVAQEVSHEAPTAGYLWPAPPAADPLASPALGL